MPSRDDQPPLTAAQADHSFFGHPRGLATLFFTEMWERFSYYGMRAILILFMVDKIAHGGLGFGVDKAGSVYGLYTSMVYLLCLGGGWIADRVTGQQRAVLMGGIFIAAGEFCLVVPTEVFFYAGPTGAGVSPAASRSRRTVLGETSTPSFSSSPAIRG